MKKKIIISVIIIIICLLVVAGIICFNAWNNRAITTITMDINSGIKIELNEDGLVKSVKSVDKNQNINISDVKDKTLDEVLELIADDMFESDEIEDNYTAAILHIDGEMDSTEVANKIGKVFEDRNVQIDIIYIDKITKEDEVLAKKYNITPAKAAYINSIKEDVVDVPEDAVVNKPTVELKDVKEHGYYCEEGWTLRGSFCEKEITKVSAKEGVVCPEGYLDYNGVCYQETGTIETNNLLCNKDYKLENGQCVNTEIVDAEAEYSCDSGELILKGDLFSAGDVKNRDKYYCIDRSTGQKPVLRCKLNKNHLEINGKCYNGPAPLIGGGCPDGGLKRNGGCYTLDNEDQWECPDGSIYMKSKEIVPELCPDTFTYMTPNITGYSCPEGFEIENNKCIKTDSVEPEKERVCPEGYKTVEEGRCINNIKVEKTNGYYCEDNNYRLRGNMCILFEEVEAKHG